MKNKVMLKGFLALALTVVLLAGCDSGGSGSKPPQPQPELTGTVEISGTQAVDETLTATTDLNGTGEFGYQWARADTVNGEYAAISTGKTKDYTTVADDNGKYIRVSVTSAGYIGSVTSSPVKIYANSGSIPTVTAVTVSPNTAKVAQGKTQQFSATVTGDTSNEVSWTVDSAASSIDASGKLTVGTDESKSTLTVTAVSVANSAKTSSAAVSVLLRLTGQVSTEEYDPPNSEWPDNVIYTPMPAAT